MTIRRINFRQSGGFAGLLRGCDLVLSDLTSAERKVVDKAVARSGLVTSATPTARRSARKPAHPEARDLTQYDITLETEDGVSTVRFDDLSVTDAVQPLITFLQKRATPMPLDHG